MKIDGEWNTGSIKEERLYQARKEVYKQEAKKAFRQSQENKTWIKRICIGSAIAYVLGAIINCCSYLHYLHSWWEIVMMCVYGLYEAGAVALLLAIVRGYFRRQFIKKYIAKKEIEDLKEKD